MNSKIEWIHRVTLVLSKLRKMVYGIKQIRIVLSLKSIKTVYLALVKSLIIQCIICWSSVYYNAHTQLQTRQNVFIRVTSKKNTKYSTKKLLNILTI